MTYPISGSPTPWFNRSESASDPIQDQMNLFLSSELRPILSALLDNRMTSVDPLSMPFKYDASTMNQDLSDCKNLISKCEDAVVKIQEYIENQLNQPNISAADREKLKSEEDPLMKLQQQLVNFSDFLLQIKFVPSANDPNKSIVQGPDNVQKLWSDSKDSLINGDPDKQPPGGFLNVVEQLMGDWLP